MGAPGTGKRHWDLKIVLLSAALLLSIGGNLLWLSERMKKEEWKENYPLLSPILRNIEKEGTLSQIRQRLPLGELRQDLAAIINDAVREAYQQDSSSVARVGVYLEDLTTGAWIGVDEREAFAPLSLMKVPLAMMSMRKVDRGEWTMDQTFTVEKTDIDTRPDILKDSVSPGDVLTLKTLLENLLGPSDNNAFFLLRRQFTNDEKEDAFIHMGMLMQRESGEFRLTPKYGAAIFRSLFYSTYLRLDSAQYLLSLMSTAKHRFGLRNAIPEIIPVSHKVGFYYPPAGWQGPFRESFLHDVGIIYFPNRPYLLAVMTTDLDSRTSAALVRSVAGQTYEFYSKHQKTGEKGR